jgi:signal transduction histidine kinase
MNTLRILAVDDEQGMLEGIERALRHFTVDVPDVEETVAFEIVCASDGPSAVQQIRARPPDLLLLDYKLPGMDGLEVLQQVADLRDSFLTIVITAYASIQTAVAATKQGAYDFLPKPFTPADLKHTVRKAAIRQVLARRARELREQNRRARFEFIRVLGHELKAPLAAASGYLYLMRDRALGSDLAAYDDAVARGLLRLDQMRKLIVDLLDMTRLESGVKQRTLEPVNLVEVAQAALEVVRTEAEQRHLELAIRAPASLVLPADRGELDMLFNNLVSNAVKYNRDGGRVEIAIEPTDAGAVVRVSDTGFGMTPEEVRRLFGEFVRIRNENTRNILGSGLGLSIVRKIVALYGGTVGVDSTPGVGTTFTATLRREAAEPAVPPSGVTP